MRDERRQQRSLIASILGATLAIAALFPTPVTAAGFHGYSHAWENTGGNFTGMQNRRIDQAVAGLPSTGCSAPYQGSPVYQTMWLHLAGTGNFYELGTGHQCNDQYRYWYWGLSANGQWTSLGSQAGITNGVQHLFRMDRQATGQSTYAIYYRIDGVTKRTFATGAVVGAVLDVGLESYCQGCVVDGYSNQDLKYLKAGVWSFWAGQDGQQANDPPMCGHWAGVTVWWSGEEAAC